MESYLAQYSEQLDAYVDRRVVGNVIATVAGIVQTRTALTLSELGSALCGLGHAEAGIQRLQRALHHQGWQARLIEEVPGSRQRRAERRCSNEEKCRCASGTAGVLEKPESEHLQGLGAVRASLGP